MNLIPEKDRERLRNLARKQLEYANCDRNDVILKQWDALAHGRRESPTVRLLFCNFCDEVVLSYGCWSGWMPFGRIIFLSGKT